MILPIDVPSVIIGRHASKKLSHINKVQDETEKTHVLSKWDKRWSARVMNQMRSNIEQILKKEAKSRKSERTQETERGINTTDGEKTENSKGEDENAIIVRKVQKVQISPAKV